LTVSIFSPVAAVAQTASITGSVMDAKGGLLPKATVTIKNVASGQTVTVTTDAQGHFSAASLGEGTYSVVATAPGFAATRKSGVHLTQGGTQDVSLSLAIGDLTQQVTVEANESGSVAAALAPMDALLNETSARTEITQAFIQNFLPPTADYGEAVEMAPGTYTTNGNGVGLGQSKTFFRGFNDGFYDIDFDGIPFFDTNTPTHHSWAFFPTQWLGGIDFDRSPGTAATIGPTPFGGSIHLLSRELSPIQDIRGQASYGSFNTQLYDGEYDSGALLASHRLSMEVDVHHMSSDGYLTYDYQTRNAGSIKMQYKISDKTVLTGFSGVIWLDSNTPNFSSTRCQMYGVATGYTCTGTLAPFAGSGINFYLTNNSDPVNYLDYMYNYYHVPTDFEYVGYHTDRAHGITIDVKPYTYNYDNSEKYTNATPITESTTVNGSTTYNGLTVAPCDVAVTKKGITALPCGVDKYNSYRKYGETAVVTQTSKFGILRAGMWYEWADTNRHQFPSDPLNHWADQALGNFSEKFWTNNFQPFAEYEFHVLPKLSVNLGVKYFYSTITTKHLPDDGKTIGNLCNTTVTPTVCAPFVSNHGTFPAWLPSGAVNYRILNNWSAYGQVATGSIIPPSSVYDYNQTITASNPTPTIGTPAKQQRSTTYQGGTVLKLKRVTFDADAFHIRFQNSYSASTTLDPVVYYLQPSSITKGFEAEGNIYLWHGLSTYLNATVGRATYVGTLNATPVSGTAPVLAVEAPSGLWVANTPTDTEAEGVTYQNKAFDFGLFNKRIGSMYVDNGAYHNQATINPLQTTNAFLNYTIRSGSRFDQTKIRLSFNNIFNEHSITNDGITGTALTTTIAANGTTYTNPFVTNGPTPIAGGDQISILPGRSVILAVTFGFSPKR
jgi:iron complex outermembrane receptor protein